MVLVKRSVGFKRKYLLQHYFGAPALEACWWPATPVVMYIQYVSTSQPSQSVQALLNIGLGPFEHYASHWLGQVVQLVKQATIGAVLWPLGHYAKLSNLHLLG